MPPRRLFEQGAAHGEMAAAGCSAGVHHPEVQKVLDEFATFRTPAAQEAFAGRWLVIVSNCLESTWPVVYTLLDLVRQKELYKRPNTLSDHRTFDTFEGFFEAVMGRPFEVWSELEQTYQFVANSRPALLQGNYSQARKEAVQAGVDKATSPDVVPLLPATDEAKAEAGKAGGAKGAEHGKKGGRPRKDATVASSPPPAQTEETPTLCDNVGVSEEKEEKRRGTDQTYLARRLKRDRPDLIEALEKGELKSVYAAAKVAGIIKTPTPLEQAQKAFVKLSTEERAAFLDWVTSQSD